MHPFDLSIAPTPNPNALKFILNNPVAINGKSTYLNPEACNHNPLALGLFHIRGVDQVHFFENTITVTKFSFEPWDQLEISITEYLKSNIENHNPDYQDPGIKQVNRADLSPELQAIEAVLDRTIRPGLQADGGDLTCVSYEDPVLLVRYEGACGTCPSSAQGTLMAISSILQEEYNPNILVYIAPAEGS